MKTAKNDVSNGATGSRKQSSLPVDSRRETSGPKSRGKPAKPAGQERVSEFTNDADFARHYDVSTRTVQSWRKAGMPCHAQGRRYLYRPAETTPWIEAYRRGPARGASDDPLSPATTVKLLTAAEKLKQERLKAAKMERQARVEEGNVLSRDEWELYAIEVCQLARDRFMRLPILLCKHIPQKYHRVMRQEGDAEARKILTEMARHLSVTSLKEK